MLELMLFSLFTLVPDYLYRRYVQGKRIGKEITLFSVWYELRWGITGCLMLTISLITLIFYFHPSTTSAMLFFRTVPIAPETVGRVAEVKVGFSQAVSKGSVLFTLDSEAASGRRDSQEQDRRGRRRSRCREGGRGEGRGAAPAGERRLQAGQGRTRRQERAAAAQSGHRAAARHR